MLQEEQEDIIDTVDNSSPSDETDVSDNETIEQDLLDSEKKPQRTKAEKLLYTKKRIEEQLKELGITQDNVDDDEKPVTIGMLKRLQADKGVRTATELAEQIEDAQEKKAVLEYLGKIKPSGNGQEDFKMAKALASSLRNERVAEELARKPESKTFSSGSGAPAKNNPTVEFTAQELIFMQPPVNLTKEQILAARR